MTSPQRSLRPAGGDNRRAFLSALELVARSRMQLAQTVGTVVGQSMSLEPGPQVFDGIQVRCIRWQECNLDVSSQAVEILAHQATAMCLQAIPDDQQRLLQMGLERLQKFDDLFLLDAALVQSEQTVGTRESCDDRDVVPVEVKLNDGRLSFGSPGAHSGRAFADTGFVYEDNQSAFSLGFFLRAGQVRRFQLRTASSLRSIARFSGFCGLNPREPRMRQTCVWLKRTPCMRSMTAPTRLSVHNSVPNPCVVGLCRRVARIAASCSSSSWAGRPRSGTSRRASMPPSSSNRFHVSVHEKLV